MPLIIPILFLLCMLYLVVVPLIIRPTTVGVGLVLVLCTGTPAYLFGVMWKNKPQSLMKLYVELEFMAYFIIFAF